MICPANCPACGAPITPTPDIEGFKCDFCHSVFYPDNEDEEVAVVGEQPDPSHSLACPICSLALVSATIAQISVLYCKQCHGLLFPMNLLPPLNDALRIDLEKPPAVQQPPDPGDLKRAIECPKCHRRMDTHFYAGPGNVIVDTCPDCWLIWLDRGELIRIAHAPDEGDTDESNW
jgi:Zn-finger nucleic acid-binding protein